MDIKQVKAWLETQDLETVRLIRDHTGEIFEQESQAQFVAALQAELTDEDLATIETLTFSTSGYENGRFFNSSPRAVFSNGDSPETMHLDTMDDALSAMTHVAYDLLGYVGEDTVLIVSLPDFDVVYE